MCTKYNCKSCSRSWETYCSDEDNCDTFKNVYMKRCKFCRGDEVVLYKSTNCKPRGKW